MPSSAAFDANVPSPARIYDYLCGGKDNYAADRAAGDEINRLFPGMGALVRQHREFARAAAAWMAEGGIRQFIDISCGMVRPTIGEVVPGARVAYVDSDPVVLTHLRALAGGEGIAVVEGDPARPDEVLASPGLLKVIDLTQPAGVLLAGPLSVLDAPAARKAAEGYASALAPGSYVAACSTSYRDQAAGDAAAASYERLTGGVWFSHSRQVITEFFEGLQLVPPGVADVRAWWEPASISERDVAVLGAIGFKG